MPALDHVQRTEHRHRVVRVAQTGVGEVTDEHIRLEETEVLGAELVVLTLLDVLLGFRRGDETEAAEQLTRGRVRSGEQTCLIGGVQQGHDVRGAVQFRIAFGGGL